MSVTTNDTTPARSLDFDQVLSQTRLPLRLIDAAIAGVAEADVADPVKTLLFANQHFGDDLWTVLGTALSGLEDLRKAHDAGCSRMMDVGELAGFKAATAHYLGADVCKSLTNAEIRTISGESLSLLLEGRKREAGFAPLAGSIDHLITVLRHRLRSGSAVAQLEQARTLIQQALVTEEEVRSRPAPDPEPQRNFLDVIADGAKEAFDRGEAEEEYLAALTPGEDSEHLHAALLEHRDQLRQEGRWPWAEISVGNNGTARPVKDTTEDEMAKKLARFDRLVTHLSPERKIALLDRLEGVLSTGGRIRRSPEQDLEGDEQLRERIRNDPGGVLRTLLPAFFAADDERRRHLIALVDEVLREGADDDAAA
jgi:hypothetical protein